MSLLCGSLLFLNLCSELQGIGLNEKFLHCYEKWVQLLEKIEETLKANMADSLPALLEQQKTYEVNKPMICPLPPSPWGSTHGMRDLSKSMHNTCQSSIPKHRMYVFKQIQLSVDHLQNSHIFHKFPNIVLLLCFIND